MQESNSFLDGNKVFRIGPWLVEPSSGTLRQGKKTVHLPPKLMGLLLTLVANQNNVVTKEEIFSSVWPNTFVSESSLTRGISELRHALKDGDDTANYIETIPKKGYRFIGPVGIPKQSHSRKWIIQAPVYLSVLSITLIISYISFFRESSVHEEFQPPVSESSLAILPHEDFGVDSESDMLAAQIVEGVSESLSQAVGTKIFPGAYLAHFENNPEELKGLAERMGIEHLVETSVQGEGKDLTLSVVLYETAGKNIIWQDKYELSAGIQEEITSAITNQVSSRLNLVLGSPQNHATRPLSEEQKEAEEYLVIADHLRKTGVTELRKKAVRYAELAIEKDPSSAQAYSILAEASLSVGGWGHDDQWSQKAQKAVSKALALDDQIPESHIANGILQRTYRKDYLSAEMAFREAIRFDPENPKARREYGLLLMRNLGRPDEALHQLQEASRLDPLMSRNYSYLFELHYSRGDYEKAFANARKGFELHPSFSYNARNLALVYMLLGDNESALRWARKSVGLLDSGPKDEEWEKSYQLLSFAYLREGNITAAAETSETLNSLSPGSTYGIEISGLAALYKGDYAKSESNLKLAFDLDPRGSIWPTGIRISTYLAYVLLQEGNQVEAEKYLQISRRYNRENNAVAYVKNYWPPLVFQDALAGLSLKGEIKEAVQNLETAVSQGWNAYTMTQNNPLFSTLLASSESKQILDQAYQRVESMRSHIEILWPDESADSFSASL